MQYLKAKAVKETVARRGMNSDVYQWYEVGKFVSESGERYEVVEIRLSDEYSQFHVEVDLQDFGTIWLYDVHKIIFDGNTRERLPNYETGDSEDEDPLVRQQGVD